MQEEPTSDGSGEDDAARIANEDKEEDDEASCEGADNLSAGSAAAEDDTKDDECAVLSETTDTFKITLGLAVMMPPI